MSALFLKDFHLNNVIKPPIELVKKGEPDKVILYACGNCGSVHSPHIYAISDMDEKLRHAKLAAQNCLACRDGQKDRDELIHSEKDHVLRRRSKAQTVTDLEHCFSDSGDGFYCDPAEAEEAGETGVFGAMFRPYKVCIDSMIENTMNDHHDEADVGELVDLDDLIKAVNDFNAKQTGGSYEMNEKVWQKIPQSQTFAMIKPDATSRAIEDQMKADIVAAGFRIITESRRVLKREEAEWLYSEHKSKAHFNDLVDYTISGDVVLMLLEGDGENVPADFRALMGPTDKSKAEPHTLRAKYAMGLRENSIHGSDSPRAAIDEIVYFTERN